MNVKLSLLVFLFLSVDLSANELEEFFVENFVLKCAHPDDKPAISRCKCLAKSTYSRLTDLQKSYFSMIYELSKLHPELDEYDLGDLAREKFGNNAKLQRDQDALNREIGQAWETECGFQE